MSAGKTVSWSQIAPAPLILLSGSESYLASRSLSALKSQLRAAHPQLEVTEVPEGEYSQGLLISLAAPSLFAEPRLIVIASATEGLLSDLEQYFALEVQDCTVIVRLPNAVGHNGKVKTGLAKLALNVVCDELKKDSDRAAFVQNEFKSRGLSIDPPALKALMSAFSSDLGELGAACSQLAFSGVSKIDLPLIERTFQGRVETNAFKIADAALSGDASEAIRLYRHGFATGIDNVALTAALAMRIRTLAKLFNNANSQAAAIGMAPWQLDKARKELRLFDETSLTQLVELVAQTDADVKGASREPEYSVERLILAMARKA
jgi:DNA polymerase III subunit delta